MKKHLRKSEIRELNISLQNYNFSIDKKARVEQNDEIILVDSKPLFFFYKQRIVPTLHFLLEKIVLPKVVIDMPAVPFITKGADVMRPGIRDFDSFSKNSFVVIVDENNHKPLAVGLTLFSSEEMNSLEKGRVIHTIHFVGDSLWKSEN